MVWTLALFSITVQVKALGLNHAESHMRKGEWDEFMPFTGLKCLILVTACPGGNFAVGNAINAGAVVTATLRWWESFTQVEPLGVDPIILEGPELVPETTAAKSKFDAVSSLVANSVFIKSMTVVRRNGR